MSGRTKASEKGAENRASLKLTPAIAVISTVVIYFLAQILAVNIVALYGVAQGWPVRQTEAWLAGSLLARFAVYLFVALAGIGLVYGVLRLVKATWRMIGLRRPVARDAMYALAGFGWYLPLYIATAYIVSVVLPSVDLEQSQQLGFSPELNGSGLIFVFVSLVVLPPLYEEILARGLLFTGLRSKLSLPAAALLTSLLFGVAHLQWGSGAPLLWAAAIDTFVLSMVLVVLREKTGSLWPAIGLHAIKNCVAFTLIFIIKTG